MNVVDGDPISKRIITLPIDGDTNNADHSYGTIFSTATDVYATGVETVGGGDIRNHVWRFPVTDGEMASTPAESATPYSARDSEAFHRSMGVGVDAEGYVHVGEHYIDGFRPLRSDSPGDLSSFSTAPRATTGNVDARNSYTTYKLYGGQLYMHLQDRHTSSQGIYIYKWDLVAEEWEVLARALRFTDGSNGRAYSGHVVVDGDDIYIGGSRMRSGSEMAITGSYPDWWCIASDDGGSSWHRPSDDGTIMSLPADETTADLIQGTSLDPGEGDKYRFNLAVTPDGTVHVAGAWANDANSDTDRRAYYGKLTSSGWELDPVPFASGESAAMGYVQIVNVGSTLVMFEDTSWNTPGTGRNYVYVSGDGGDNWTRHLFHDKGETDDSANFTLDYHSLGHHGKVRGIPNYNPEDHKAEVWEFDLPGVELPVLSPRDVRIYSNSGWR